MKEQEIGYVSKFFGQISVAAIEINAGKLNIGDTIHIKGYTTDFNTEIESMQVEHELVERVKKGDSIGVKVARKVRRNDKVFKLVDWNSTRPEQADKTPLAQIKENRMNSAVIGGVVVVMIVIIVSIASKKKTKWNTSGKYYF